MADTNFNAQPGGSSARSKTFPAAMPSQSETNSMPNIPSGHYSPLRHHKRTQSMGPRAVKETLDACLDYGDEDNGVRVNQYVMFIVITEPGSCASYGGIHAYPEPNSGTQLSKKSGVDHTGLSILLWISPVRNMYLTLSLSLFFSLSLSLSLY